MANAKAVAKKDDALPNVGKAAARALAGIGVTRLSQVRTFTESELLSLHGVGPKAVRLLAEALAAVGATLKG